MQNRGNNMPGLGGGNSNYNSPQQQSYPGQSAMMSSPTKSYGNNTGNNNRSFQPPSNNSGNSSYSSPSNNSFKSQWENNNNIGGINTYSPSNNSSNSSNFSSPNNAGDNHYDRFQPPTLQNTQSGPYNSGNSNDRNYSGNQGYPGSPMQNNDRGFGNNNDRGFGGNNDQRGFGNNQDNNYNNFSNNSSGGNPNAFPGQGSMGGIGSNAMGGGIGSNAMGGGGIGSKLFGSDNNPSSPSFLSGGLGGGSTGPKKDIAEKANDLIDLGKLKISESKRLVIGGLTKLGVVKDDTPEELKRLIMEIDMVNKQFEVLADLSKKMWTQTESLIDSRKQLATFFYSTGCKETEPISANLQEVGLLYQQLEYNDKLILLHLSDTMRDIEFFRQNIIGDALAGVQKTQTARANWLNMLDAQGQNSSGGSGVQNNVVNQKRQLQELEARYNDCFSQLEIKVMLLKDKRSVELSAKFMASGKAWALYHSNLSEHLQLVDANIVCEETQDFRELMVNIHS